MLRKNKPGCLTLFLFLLLFLQPKMAQSQSPSMVIDSLVKKTVNALPEEQFVRNCFTIADNFMELDRYDSAQSWLNRVAEILPLKQPSLLNYFLSTRQAEVYYYNGLQRLGLQESERSLSIAKALRDSFLLADSYNFLGLFYINLDSFRTAIPFFKKGIEYVKQPPFPSGYLSLSKPHHLYGNMSEAYEKMGMYDSAIYFSRISLSLASSIKIFRGTAVAHYNLASSFLKQGQTDSALVHFTSCFQTAIAGGDVDVELIAYGGLAKAEDGLHHKAAAMQWLESGAVLIQGKPFINSLFTNQFLDDAISIYEKYGETTLAVASLKSKTALLHKQISNNNHQINVILNAGLQNETRLLNLQVKESQQRSEIANTRVYLLISLVILLIAAFIFYRYKARQKLQIVQLQNKISQDLHDDVGSSLSSLQVYSAVADNLLDKEPVRAREMLRKISRESASVMENIGDIVWSMKTETEQSIDQRIKNFVNDVLGAANIQYKVFVEEGIEENIRNMEARKNIILIIKEAVNNAVKYSKAGYISVSIKKLAGQLCVQISDDGIGFNKEAPGKKGDGLSNMQRRTLELGGIYEVTTNPGKGTTVSALFPLTKISDSH